MVGWGVGILLGMCATSPFLRFYSAISQGKSFVPNNFDVGIAMADVFIILCTYFYVGLLVAPHKKAGFSAWLILPIVLLMIGAQLLTKGYFMGPPSSGSEYGNYREQSLPLGLRSAYLFSPFLV